jgi:hypothetical protein
LSAITYIVGFVQEGQRLGIGHTKIRSQPKQVETPAGMLYGAFRQIDSRQSCERLRKALVIRAQADTNFQHILIGESSKRAKLSMNGSSEYRLAICS